MCDLCPSVVFVLDIALKQLISLFVTEKKERNKKRNVGREGMKDGIDSVYLNVRKEFSVSMLVFKE